VIRGPLFTIAVEIIGPLLERFVHSFARDHPAGVSLRDPPAPL